MPGLLGVLRNLWPPPAPRRCRFCQRSSDAYAPDRLMAAAKRLLAAAVAYARKGWAVFPLHEILPDGRCSCVQGAACPTKNRGKHPRTRHGFKEASSDERQVLEWWTAWPGANIGLATGRASGVYVLDIDVKPDQDGFASLNGVEAEIGAAPETLSAETGTGGRHLYFAAADVPADRRVTIGQGLKPGIDLRGDGGYVVLPPSCNASGAYRWVSSKGSGPAAAGWLLRFLDAVKPPLRPSRPVPAGALDAPLTQKLRRASAYLARVPGAISGSGGHAQTWIAVQAVVQGFDLPEGIALALLLDEYNPRCDPPWSEGELRHKVESVVSKCRKEPGFLLAERSDAMRRVPRPVADALRQDGGAAWVGSRAVSAGVVDDLASVVPEEFRGDVLDGAQRRRDGRSVPKPDGVDDAHRKRVTRSLEELVGKEGWEDDSDDLPEIARLVRFPDLGQVLFDIDLCWAGETASLRHLTAADVMSYPTLCVRAFEQKVALPEPKKAAKRWRRAIKAAVVNAEDADPAEEATVAGAVRAEIRRRLKTTDFAEDYADLMRGRVWYDEEKHVCMVYPALFVDRVRAALSADKPPRQLIMDVAWSLDMAEKRPRIEGTTKRPTLWAFPMERERGDTGDEIIDGVAKGRPPLRVLKTEEQF